MKQFKTLKFSSICLMSVCALAFAGGHAPAQTSAQTPAAGVPFLASHDFGWQSNVADWQDLPPGYGHGPIGPDPAHPYISNAVGGRTGQQPTLRIGDAKDPVLKPWAAQQMLASNEEVISGIRQSPFAAQANYCFPSNRFISCRRRERFG